MTILFVLITASSLVAGLFLFAFIWSVKTGQFDDSYTPSVRMLFDDEILSNELDQTKPPKTEKVNPNNNENE